MKTFFILFLFLYFLSNNIYAQAINHVIYVETAGGEKRELPTCITPSFDKGFVVGILSESQNGNINTSCPFNESGRVTFKKFDAGGTNLEWEICSPTYKYRYLFPTADSGLVYVGYSWDGTGPTDREFLAKKVDKNGNLLWDKAFGGTRTEQLRKVITTWDGGFLLVGETASNDGDVGTHKMFNEFDADIWIIKIDSLGNKMQAKLLEGSNYEWAADVVEGQDHCYYILGSTTSGDDDCNCAYAPGAFYDAYLAKLDSVGNTIWTKCYGNTVKGSLGKGITSNGSNGFYLTASTSGSGKDVMNFKGEADIWVLNVDSSGKILWSNCYGSTKYNEEPRSICKTDDGNIWVAGISHGKDEQVYEKIGDSDSWILKISPNGTLLSSRVLGTHGITEANCIHPLPNNSMIIAGSYSAEGEVGSVFPPPYHGGIFDVFIARLAPWTTDVKEKYKLNDKLIAYPNPTKTFINLELGDIFNIKNIAIYDLNGRKVYKANTMPKDAIDVSNWNRGLYEVRVKTAGDVYATKILIQ